jgi:hypothetical protein
MPPVEAGPLFWQKKKAATKGGLSKVQSVDQRTHLECGVRFRQLRTCRRTRPGQLWANKRHQLEMKEAAN